MYERLKELLNYDPDTGVFTYRQKCGKKRAGDVAGTINDKGYTVITIDYRIYPAHRLAWLYVHGEWPKQQVDHINRIRNDNRIASLRDVNQSENILNASMLSNNKSGHKGVYFCNTRKKWVAQYKRTCIGAFTEIDHAVKARQEYEGRA
jgi:hypothetical protein